jgi:predicted PurR-regulated permease PerM
MESQLHNATGEAGRRSAHAGDGSRPWSRNQLSAVVLFLGSAVLLFACYQMVAPFLPSLAWALALAIVAHPIHGWMSRHVHKPGLAAALSVVVVALVIAGPVALLLQMILSKAAETVKPIQSGDLQKHLEQALSAHPQWSRVWGWIQADPGALLNQITGSAQSILKATLGGSVWSIVTILVAFLLLFYFWRDRRLFMSYIRHFLPLSEEEASSVLSRLRDTVHASIYGTLVVAGVQGTLGGLMFWWLGLPAPLLWGVVMVLLSVVPVLGAFVIWIPVAVFLAATGHWTKAVILAVWGTVVIGLIDNLLYPILVGKRLRLHTVPVFIGIVGGLMVFGASGLVLGPVLIALADAVLNIWRCRTMEGRTADKPPAGS